MYSNVAYRSSAITKRQIKTIDFSRYSSIKVGPVADVYMIEDENYPDDGYLIGSANNLLVGPEHPPLMKLSKCFDFIVLEDDTLRIGAATPGGKIVSFCKKNNIANFEFMAHLPGTLGGMLQMNAGLKEYEVFNYLVELRTKNGWIKKEEIGHGYRWTAIDDVVFEARFERHEGFDATKIEMFKAMRSNQPSDASAGSCFKNPDGDYAGRLIDVAGLKGKRIGDMQFSTVHANFLVNLGEGTFDDAMALIMLAEKKVKEMSGISLEREIIVVDRRYLEA